MLNFDGNYAQCGHMSSIGGESIWKLWNHLAFAHLPRDFGNVTFKNKVAVALRHIAFQLKYSRISAKWIMKVLWVPNVHHHNNIGFSWRDFVRECRIWEIILWLHLGRKLFGSLWLMCNQRYGWKLSRILPRAPVKTVDKSRINETYSLMKFPIWSLSLRLHHVSMLACTQVRGGMQIFVHDGAWCFRKHYY